MPEPPSTRKYNALDKAWKKIINYDILPEQKQKYWDSKLEELEQGKIDIKLLYQFIEANFTKNEVKRIYSLADKNIEDKRKKEQEEDKNNLKEFNLALPSLNISNYMENAKRFWEMNPYFYDEDMGVFWMWDGLNFKYEMIKEPKLMDLFDNILGFQGQTVASTVKNNHLEAFKRYGIRKKPKEAPIKWIQFKNKAFSINSKQIYDVKPNYFFTNPLPWEIGESEDTPMLDKLFSEWVGEKHLPDLYEFISYCCYRDYPIQLLFCLYGHGRNGKSTFINIVDKFLGKENTCTTDLDMIAGKNKNRFETIRLYKKLACFMGETNFNVLDNSSILKKLVGGDKIGFEIKGAGLFDDVNYSKIIIASNSLPSSEDTSEGFYRRWHIINFPNQFPEGKDISLKIPDIEFNNLAKKVMGILPKLLEKGSFSNQGTIEERRQRYILASNPLPFFIEKCCYQKPDGFIRYSKMYLAYTTFLKANKRRIVSKKEFTKVLNAEGFENRRTSKEGEIDQYIEGLEINPDFGDFGDFAKFQLPYISKFSSYKKDDNPEKCETQDIVLEKTKPQDTGTTSISSGTLEQEPEITEEMLDEQLKNDTGSDNEY